MTNLKQVAELAGVSASTVSRALNGKSYVNEATRQKVLEAVDVYKRQPHGGCGVQPACAGGGFCAAQAAVTWNLTPVPMEWNRDLLVFEMLLPYLKRGRETVK